MIRSRLRQYYVLALLTTALLLGNSAPVFAQTSSSSHYTVNETEFGAGSALNDCSSSYCAKESAGDLVGGMASSSHYKAVFGPDTNDKPLLEVIANGGTNSLGTLTTSSTATLAEQVSVRCYLSDGYSMQISGAPPSQGEHYLTNLASPTASAPGTEQFGINLVANSTPDIGANVVQVPSSQFSFGAPTSDYATADKFMYVDGGVIASSATSSGETDYTISMIINISNVTPGGQYTGNYSAVIVPSY
jgi:hypothetical protein